MIENLGFKRFSMSPWNAFFSTVCVLKIKLAECEIIKAVTGEEPLLLLDDVLSELDIKRREFFTSNIKERQVIITCTDKSLAGEKDGEFYLVDGGTVKKE